MMFKRCCSYLIKSSIVSHIRHFTSHDTVGIFIQFKFTKSTSLFLNRNEEAQEARWLGEGVRLGHGAANVRAVARNSDGAGGGRGGRDREEQLAGMSMFMYACVVMFVCF